MKDMEKPQEPKYVDTNMGRIPYEDYLEIVAMQNGFSSYEEMKKEGYSI